MDREGFSFNKYCPRKGKVKVLREIRWVQKKYNNCRISVPQYKEMFSSSVE